MPKKKPKPISVKVADGGKLASTLAENAVGLANYTEKRNIRRDLEGEVLRDGTDIIRIEGRKDFHILPGSGPIGGLHEFTDHDGNRSAIGCRGGSIFAYLGNDKHLSYMRDRPIVPARVVLTLEGGSVVGASLINSGFGYYGTPVNGVRPTFEEEDGATGGGLDLRFTAEDGRIIEVEILDGGNGYGDSLEIEVVNVPYVDPGYFSESTIPAGWIEISRGLHYRGDGSPARRWEIVESSGYVIINNGYDLPRIYHTDWDEAVPLYGMRESNIASVGTIHKYGGNLICGDITRIVDGQEFLANDSTVGFYGCVYDDPGVNSSFKIERVSYSIMWSAYGHPWLYEQGFEGSIQKGSARFKLKHDAGKVGGIGATFSVGDPVYIPLAGINGARLDLKNSSNTVIEGISAVSNIFYKKEHGLDDGERIRIVDIGSGSGLGVGSDYYVVILSDDTFQLANDIGRRATATLTLNGTSLSYKITDPGAGYDTDAVSISTTGLSMESESVERPYIRVRLNNLGQVSGLRVMDDGELKPVEDASLEFYPVEVSDGVDEIIEIQIGRPVQNIVDIPVSIRDMIIMRPNLHDEFQSIIQGGVKQEVSVRIQYSPPTVVPTLKEYFRVDISEESYLIETDTYDGVLQENDVHWSVSEDEIIGFLVSKINADSRIVKAKTVQGGFILESLIAGRGFDVSIATSETGQEGAETNVRLSTITPNSTGGATDAQIEEAYLALYGRPKLDQIDNAFNNPVKILGVKGPYDLIGVSGEMMGRVSQSSNHNYQITLLLDKDTTGELEVKVEYDFSAKFHASEGVVLDEDYDNDRAAALFLAGLAEFIQDNPVLSEVIDCHAYGVSEKEPWIWIWAKDPSRTVEVSNIIREEGGEFTAGNKVHNQWNEPTGTVIPGSEGDPGTWYETQQGALFYLPDGEDDWIYWGLGEEYDDDLIDEHSDIIGGWVYVPAYRDSTYCGHGMFIMDRRPEWGMEFVLDAFASSDALDTEIRRFVNIGGVYVYDFSLGAGYQDWQEDGSAINKFEPLGDYMVGYRKNGIFVMSKTTNPQIPFGLKTVYTGQAVPTFPNSVMNILGNKHIYWGNDGPYEISVGAFYPVVSMKAVAASSFWRNFTGDKEAVFAVNNPSNFEYYLSIPGEGTLCYDYKYDTFSTSELRFLAATTMHRFEEDGGFWFIMALEGGLNEIVRHVRGSAFMYDPVTKSLKPFVGIIQYGMTDLGDSLNNKTIDTVALDVKGGETLDVGFYSAYNMDEKYLWGEDEPDTTLDTIDIGDGDRAIFLHMEGIFFQLRMEIPSQGNMNFKYLGYTMMARGTFSRSIEMENH